MVAITVLMMAIVGPMSLTAQSLAASYYARDQITAFNLAQEALETVRHLRDGNMLDDVFNPGAKDSFAGIFTDGTPFTVDTHDDLINQCPSPSDGPCPLLQTDGTLYGYNLGTNTIFTRTVTAHFVTGWAGRNDDLKVTVTVTWKTGAYQTRSFTISEDLFRWLDDGHGA